MAIRATPEEYFKQYMDDDYGTITIKSENKPNVVYVYRDDRVVLVLVIGLILICLGMLYVLYKVSTSK